MRPDQGSIFAGTIMKENAQTNLRHILERTEAPPSSDADNLKKLKAAYNACLDEATVNERGSKPLTNILDELKTIYPAKAGLVKGAQDQLTSALLYLANAGVEALASSGVTVSLCGLYFTNATPLTTPSSPTIETLIMLLSWSRRLVKSDFPQENTIITQRPWLTTRPF